MPSLQDIRKFNNRLISMGDEPSVVRSWGEEVEEVPEPEEGVSSDLSDLLADDDLDRPAAPSFDDLLSDEDSESPDETFDEFDDEAISPIEDDFDDQFGDDFFGGLDDFVTDEAEPDETGGDDVFPPDFDDDEENDEFGDEMSALMEGLADEQDSEEAAEVEPEVPEQIDEQDEGFDLDGADFGFPDAGDDDFFAGLDDELEPASSDEPEELESPADDEFGDDLRDFDLPDEGGALDDGSEELPADGLGELGGFEFTDEEDEEFAPPGDDFSFDEPPVVPGEEAPRELSAPSLDELADEDLEEFSLGDFGAEFGVLEDEGPSEEDLNPAINVPEVAAQAAQQGRAPGDFQLSDEDFRALQATLAGLPLNVKLAVEEVIAEAKGTTEDVEKLCRMLVGAKSAQEIANYVGRIVGKQIKVPRGYEKQTGFDFEEERSSFRYQFRENIWPILRVVGLLLVVVTLLGVAGYNVIYRPLYARSLYLTGLEYIENDQYSLGNQSFDQAWEVWQNPNWYYEYAEAFIRERQYTLAGEKYEELLFGRSAEEQRVANEWLSQGRYEAIIAVREPPKRGILDYAEFQSEILADYERAERLLQLILVGDTGDYDARLLLADNYMNWAEEDPTQYENARLAYARLIERFGQTDELLSRMLRYFIRTDNLDQAVVLKDVFQNDPRATINPEIYAELAGYLIDNGQLSDVEDILFRVLDVDNTLPEVHYELARYYEEIDATGEEELALNTARLLLSETEPLTSRYRGMLIDTHTRIGENQYAAANYLDAQESFTSAIQLYEEGLRRRVLQPNSVFARSFARLGDIFYYVAREYDQALLQYDRAEETGYDTPDLDYRQGFIYYRQGVTEQALQEFREAELDPVAQTNALLWAMANTHYVRGSYFAAEAFYRELLDRVERQRDSIDRIDVEEDPTHRSVIEYLFKGYNNLGVTLQVLSEQTGSSEQYSDGLVYLTQSTELAENYQRDPDTLTRTEDRNLAFLNQREALYPTPEYEFRIYNQIPEDLDDRLF